MAEGYRVHVVRLHRQWLLYNTSGGKLYLTYFYCIFSGNGALGGETNDY